MTKHYDAREQLQSCPQIEQHTSCPDGYTQWHDWAASMAYKGYRQRRCEGCGLYAIWRKP